MAKMPPIKVSMTFDMTAVEETLNRMRRAMAAMGVLAPHPVENPTWLRFDYRNWRGADHEYIIEVESMTFQSPGELKPACWCVNGTLISRDGDERPEMGESRRRTFILTKMYHMCEIESQENPLNLDTLGPTEV